MTVTAMNHFTILTDDVDRTVTFYRDFLGLEPGPRPTLGFPGAWLYGGGTAIVHVIGDVTKDRLRPGVIDHMAFSAQGLADTLAKLDRHAIKYAARRQIDSRVWQVFFFDPNGARIELDFAAEEDAPASLA
jgi:catechol 2,3-dioxygenase-like lactoylglutathione lyase family enzyme